jgi:hypothetical protein
MSQEYNTQCTLLGYAMHTVRYQSKLTTNASSLDFQLYARRKCRILEKSGRKANIQTYTQSHELIQSYMHVEHKRIVKGAIYCHIN